MRSALFAQALARPARLRSRHFALHHLPAGVVAQKLSTSGAPTLDASVDDSSASIAVLVPKRHARRAVTRSLVKRQARAALGGVDSKLAPGFWLLRLRAPFEPHHFPSAASDHLRSVVRAELDRLASSAVEPARLA